MLPKRAKIHQLQQEWDLVVIGGGITGAGVALVAAQQQLRVLLVEKKDYAWGTSSRSSKMVHGGLRYLAQGDIKLTRESLQERELMLRELPSLVHRETYIFPVMKKQFPGRWAMQAALFLYDLLAGIRDHRWLPLATLRKKVPALVLDDVKGAMAYTDAITDDSRLVQRILQEASASGAEMINYVSATKIEAQNDASVVHLCDEKTGDTVVINTKKVINATGVWVDELSASSPKVRPLRGSHLILPADKLPVNSCMALLHPKDKRPVFVFPWYGCTVIGTTDLDHTQPKAEEAFATPSEISYLLELLQEAFPCYNITAEDIISTQAGVRPIIASGKGKDPSKERRDHLVWEGAGRINVSGGKLTTFRVIALDALLAANLIDEATYKAQYKKRQFLQHDIKWPAGLGDATKKMPTEEQVQTWWRWAIRHEQVVHLDDLLLRRTRVGNLFKDGGLQLLNANKDWLIKELGWDDSHWSKELARYEDIWRTYYQARTA